MSRAIRETIATKLQPYEEALRKVDTRVYVTLAKAVEEYLDEYDNPAKDYGLRAIRRDQLRKAFTAVKQTKCEGCGQKVHIENDWCYGCERHVCYPCAQGGLHQGSSAGSHTFPKRAKRKAK